MSPNFQIICAKHNLYVLVGPFRDWIRMRGLEPDSLLLPEIEDLLLDFRAEIARRVENPENLST